MDGHTISYERSTELVSRRVWYMRVYANKEQYGSSGYHESDTSEQAIDRTGGYVIAFYTNEQGTGWEITVSISTRETVHVSHMEARPRYRVTNPELYCLQSHDVC